MSLGGAVACGSSMMPHKRNPDLFELVRGQAALRQGELVALLTTFQGLGSGYHRDLQLLKENLFPAFSTLRDSLRMSRLMLENIRIREDILKDEKYRYLFSVEVVNRLVLEGTPFREAYKQVGLDIESGKFEPDTDIRHTHEGSIGNLQNEAIKSQMDAVIASFPFAEVHAAIDKLVK